LFEHREAHFGSLKHANDLLVYQGFMIPRNHQAGMQGILKEHLRASFLDSISLGARSNSCGVFTSTITNSSELHCASLLDTIFASLARVHIHSIYKMVAFSL